MVPGAAAWKADTLIGYGFIHHITIHSFERERRDTDQLMNG
jgi:hypothetical protein